MRFALVRLHSTIDPRGNLVLVTDAASRAARGGTDVVALPEATMYSFLQASTQVVEAFDGPWASAVRCLAGDFGIAVVASMLTRTPDARVHDTFLATDESEGCYDKVHLFDALGQRESRTVAPGLRSTSIEVAGHGLGLAICYDVRFPARFINLVLRGATVVVVCASWASGPGKLHQ